MSKFKKYLFITLGTISTALGIIGIFIPVLPTTPFLLLAAILYSRSSEKFLHWLYTNKLCGEYIKNYRDGKGIPLKQKIFSIMLLWLTIGSSAIFFIDSLWVRIMLGVIAIGVTTHLVRVKTYRPEPESPPPTIQVKDQALEQLNK
jgi:uncharacterized membrane protein YbaN (DUF454 family)